MDLTRSSELGAIEKSATSKVQTRERRSRATYNNRVDPRCLSKPCSKECVQRRGAAAARKSSWHPIILSRGSAGRLVSVGVGGISRGQKSQSRRAEPRLALCCDFGPRARDDLCLPVIQLPLALQWSFPPLGSGAKVSRANSNRLGSLTLSPRGWLVFRRQITIYA